MNLAFDSSFSFARKSAAIDKNFATVRNDVRLSPAANRADVDGRKAQQWMMTAPKLAGVFGFKQINHSSHRVDGIAAQFRPSAMRG